MRIPLFIAASALLCGCSTIDNVREAWYWDSTRAPGQARAQLAPQELASLTNRVADLQLRRNEIRARISAEPDIWARQRLYADLHSVGMQLSPLERRLVAMAPAR